MVLNELKARGVKDIPIAVVDGLKGFSEALETAFPRGGGSDVHRASAAAFAVECVRTRNGRNWQRPSSGSTRQRVRWKQRRLWMHWRIVHWRTVSGRGSQLAHGMEPCDTVFAFSAPIRKAIYTTNAIESLNSVIRRAVKLRGHFTSPRAARKLIYLGSSGGSADRWKQPGSYWGVARREFCNSISGSLPGFQWLCASDGKTEKIGGTIPCRNARICFKNFLTPMGVKLPCWKTIHVIPDTPFPVAVCADIHLRTAPAVFAMLGRTPASVHFLALPLL